MTPQEIQSLLDRLRLLITQLGWQIAKTDTTSAEIIVEIRRPKS
jgi:hypothetical protein